MISSRLPASMIALAYMAAGCCLSVSVVQMRSVFAMQAGLEGGGFLQTALPFALLFGGVVLWRMSGHLLSRTAIASTFQFALLVTILGALFIEGISIFTSSISLNLGVNTAIQAETESSEQYRAQAAIAAASAAAALELADSIENMPVNHVTNKRKAGEALAEITSSYRDMQASSVVGVGATAQTLAEVGDTFGITADQLKQRWNFAIALGLSVVPLALTFGLGALSDGTQTERAAADITAPIKLDLTQVGARLKEQPAIQGSPAEKKSHDLQSVA